MPLYSADLISKANRFNNYVAASDNILSRVNRGRYNTENSNNIKEAIETINNILTQTKILLGENQAQLVNYALDYDEIVLTTSIFNYEQLSSDLKAAKVTLDILLQAQPVEISEEEITPEPLLISGISTAVTTTIPTMAIAAPVNSLAQKNRELKTQIENTPPYTMSEEVFYLAAGEYYGGPFPKEFLAPFIHQHRIFENVHLGNYRAFLSIDPNFVTQHPLTDTSDDILSNLGLSEGRKKEALEHLEHQLDFKGCSELGVKRVLSVTNFQAANNVSQSDWSRFEPNLTGIKRDKLPVEDDAFAWENIQPYLEEAFRVIDEARANNQPILIHCVKGASRSVTVLTAYLMKRCGVTLDQAFNFIQTQRTIAELKPSIKNGLKEYERSLKHSAPVA